MPFFDELFAGDGVIDIFMHLVPNKAIQPVFLGESVNLVAAMFPCPSNKVVGDSDIKRAVRFVCGDVDVELALHRVPTDSGADEMTGRIGPRAIAATAAPG